MIQTSKHQPSFLGLYKPLYISKLRKAARITPCYYQITRNITIAASSSNGSWGEEDGWESWDDASDVPIVSPEKQFISGGNKSGDDESWRSDLAALAQSIRGEQVGIRQNLLLFDHLFPGYTLCSYWSQLTTSTFCSSISP